MRALIDADIIVYRAGHSSEKRIKGELVELYPIEYALGSAKAIMLSILEAARFSGYQGYLSAVADQTMFRLKYAKTKKYKENRLKSVCCNAGIDSTGECTVCRVCKSPCEARSIKPHYYQEIRDYLLDTFNVEVVTGIEADDALGIAQTPYSCICSIDKDLLQIPGKHYSFVKQEWYDIDEFTGWKNLFLLTLQGDTADNIPGLERIGPKTALKLLEKCKTVDDLWVATQEAYKRYSPCANDGWEGYLMEQVNLTYVLRKHNEFFPLTITI